MSLRRPLTSVELLFEEHRCNYRLVFGNPAVREVIDKTFGYTRERVFFEPGSVFCLDLWEPTAAGRTRRWKTYVLQAGTVGELLTTVPQVTPGAKVLMESNGARRCKFLLAWIKTLEDKGDPAALPGTFFEGRDLWFQGMVPEQWQPADLNRRV